MSHLGHRGRIDERLQVVCWCQLTVGLVPKTTILAGRTFSCGLPSCREPRRPK